MLQNNFNIIRLLAAIFVIYSHSFGFMGIADPMFEFTNGNFPGGQFAVYIFFILSGYLITNSWIKKNDVPLYLEKRVRRIYPALIAVVLFSIFIVGPIFTSYSLAEYFSFPQTYAYLWNLSLWKLHFYLPGVFVIGGKEHIVNSPLWTLFFEFLMYLIVILFGLMNFFDPKKNGVYVLWFLFIASLTLTLFHISKSVFIFRIGVADFVKFFAFFFSGSLYLIYFKGKKPEWYFPVGFFLIAVMARNTFWMMLPSLLFIVSGVFYIAFHERKFLTKLVSYGDFSYGTYLYGFLVQNMVYVSLGNHLNFFTHIFISLLITLPLAILSWNFVEKRFLSGRKI